MATCALAIGGAVQTLLAALDLAGNPCPTSHTCDVCSNKANAGNWWSAQTIAIEFWGCRSPDESMRAYIHSAFLIIGARRRSPRRTSAGSFSRACSRVSRRVL